MMKKIVLCIGLLAFVLNADAQRFFTKKGAVTFDATSPLEAIEATTNSAAAIVDVSNGKVEAKILIKSFHFQKALMEEHFNENYMESQKFPNAVFDGQISDLAKLDMKKDGTYTVNLKGKLTMHGVTKDVTAPATLTVKSGALTDAKTSFTIAVADYNISIPGAVRDKIAKQAKINATFKLQPMVATSGS
jgi:polyisoprenoid-binding protein YceI